MENKVGNVVRHVLVDVLLVTTIAGVAAVCTNVNKVSNSASRMFYSVSYTADQFRTMLEQLNSDFRPLGGRISVMMDRVDEILERTDNMLDPNDFNSDPRSISGKIKEILDRTNKLLDPNDFNSDPRSMGGKTKAILDNLNALSVNLRVLGEKANGQLDLAELMDAANKVRAVADKYMKEGKVRLSLF